MTAKQKEKWAYLKENHFNVFVATRQEVFSELSQQQSMFCCCGRLATGQHENNCSKFNNKVNVETISRLKHLLK